MALVTNDPQRVADWVGAQTGAAAPSVDVAIGYEIDGELLAEASKGDELPGFFGNGPVNRPTGVAVSAAGIHAAPVSLGLITA